MGIPLVRNNSVDDINTSIIAIKKELGKGGSGDMGDVNVNVDVKYEVTDTVEDGNSLPVTSQGVYDYVEGQGFTPVDEVEKNNMKAVTSNAVAKSLSYFTTEQKTGGKIVINGVEKDIYRKVIDTNAFTLGTIYATNVDRIVNQGGSIRESSGVWCAFPRSFSTTELQFRVDTSHNLIAQNANGGSFDYFSVWAEYTKNE